MRLEERKNLKLIERLKAQVLQAKDGRNTAVQAAPKPPQSAA
jgi:hypothetical protein